MTSRSSPVLDRPLTRTEEREVTAPATSVYRWALRDSSPRTGEWIQESDTVLQVGLSASEGGVFPYDLPVPALDTQIAVDGGAAVTLDLLTVTVNRTPFFTPLNLSLAFNGNVPGAGMALTLTVPTGGLTTLTVLEEVTIWAQRRDFGARDFVSAGDRGVITIMDTRFIVRSESTWDEGDTFTDDDGKTRRVQGVVQIGRSHYELLARAIG